MLISLLDTRQQGTFGHDGKNFGPGPLKDDTEDEVRQENTHMLFRNLFS